MISRAIKSTEFFKVVKNGRLKWFYRKYLKEEASSKNKEGVESSLSAFVFDEFFSIADIEDKRIRELILNSNKTEERG